MKLRFLRPAIATCSIAAWILTVGGCPLAEPTADGFDAAATPGAHYVESRDSKLYYYRLADQRGVAGEWVELNDAGEWFDGDGFYLLDEEQNWSRDESAAGLTLDEFIQLNDPAPAP